jgi:hypothetical protein
MDCSVCRDLKRAYEAEVIGYVEARSSASFRVSTNVASRKRVEMERARYDLEEHRRVCVSAVKVVVLPLDRGVSTNLKQLVA